MTIENLYQLYLKHPKICTDSRKIEPGCLFFALKGENFDANEFASKALQAGAAYTIVDDPQYASDERNILVDNVLSTLQDLARHHRGQLNIPVLGITGTNGKTTTKELINAVLSQKFKTYATQGNLNNHIGVPLTLLAIGSDIELAIIEMGANHQKEIEFLCGIAQPSCGLITNIGKAHLEGFGGLAGVKIAKSELYDALAQSGGTIFINRDNEILTSIANEKNLKNVIYYGSDSTGNFISAVIEQSEPYLSVKWQAQNNSVSEGPYYADSNLTGTYNLENILAAICAGLYFDLSPDQVNAGIKSYTPSNSRSQIMHTGKNTVISDCYNANPSSMMVALDNLAAFSGSKKTLILGDMFELGEDAPLEHRLVLEKAFSLSSANKIFVGQEFYKLKRDGANFFNSTLEAADYLKSKPVEEHTVLVKGSRGMQLESLLPLL